MKYVFSCAILAAGCTLDFICAFPELASVRKLNLSDKCEGAAAEDHKTAPALAPRTLKHPWPRLLKPSKHCSQ